MTIIRVFDVETTGLEPDTSGVCEVATCDVVRTPEGLAIGRRWDSLIDPGVPIPPEVSGIHHILDGDVLGQPSFDDVTATIMEGAPVAFCAHVAKFDRQFFEAGNIPWIDTFKVAIKLWPACPNFKNQTLRYFLKLPIPRDTPVHRAPGDVLVTAHILIEALKTGMTATEMVKITREPAMLPRLFFGMHALKPIKEIPDGYLSWMLKQADMDEDAKHTAFVELTRRRGVKR